MLRLLVSGGSNADIGSQLALSEATVKTPVGHVHDELGVRDRVQAVIFAYGSGLVEPGASCSARVVDALDREDPGGGPIRPD